MRNLICDPVNKVVMAVWGFFLKCLINQDFHQAFRKMTIIDRALFLFAHSIDRLKIWHRMPVFLGLIYLAARRHLHQEYHLLNVGLGKVDVRSNPAGVPYRTADGSYTDPFIEEAGGHGSFIGRNMPPSDHQDKLYDPNPILVAEKLLARRTTYKDTGKQFNIHYKKIDFW